MKIAFETFKMCGDKSLVGMSNDIKSCSNKVIDKRCPNMFIVSEHVN